MITNIKILEKYCTDYKKIENYDEAIKSPLIYDLHHRLEISEMQSAKDLIFLHLYYNRPPEELVFLEHREHCRLHGLNSSDETKRKRCEANRGQHRSNETKNRISKVQKGNQYALGHHCSAESRKKMSELKNGKENYWKGKHFSKEYRQKLSESHSGKHWHLENGRRIYTDY